MYCLKCRQKLPDDARFCMNCGTRTVTESGITETYRENVRKELAEVALGSLDKGEISLVDSRESAPFITARLYSIHTQLQLENFLNELAKKWPIYQTVSTHLQKKDYRLFMTRLYGVVTTLLSQKANANVFCKRISLIG